MEDATLYAAAELGIIPREEDNVRDIIIQYIDQLLVNDFERLINLLYRIDINENRIRDILKLNQGEATAPFLADLIIEREQQKIETRKIYKARSARWWENDG